jgi:CMP-N-acetylneuraminic acid synthetase
VIAGQKVLALITARGGSKGLPGKNIRGPRMLRR